MKDITAIANEVANAMPHFVSFGGNCYMTNMTAGRILREHYGIETRAVVGSFALATSKRPQDTLTFGDGMGHALPTAPLNVGGFRGHYWLQVGNRVIDFAWSEFPGIVARDAAKGLELHRVELIGIYWHFVDIVWIFLFPLLYIAK